MTVNYDTLFFFELGQWWDWLVLAAVIAGLALTAWAAIRSKWVAIAVFIVIPVILTITWWPHTATNSSAGGWFIILKQYSALIGSLSLVALQYFPALRKKYWYLCIPPIILTINIVEAVVRDIQCYFMYGPDPHSGLLTYGGPWNLMNAAAGVLNILAISGWAAIYVSKTGNKQLIWTDLSIGWIIGYDLWNLAYVYNCLADRAWYSGVGLLASCTIPAFLKFGRGAWIQYRAYTLTFWSAVILTFPEAFTYPSSWAHRSAHNPTAMFLLSFAALAANLAVVVWHFYRIKTRRLNPFTQEVYADTKYTVQTAEINADAEIQKERENRQKSR